MSYIKSYEQSSKEKNYIANSNSYNQMTEVTLVTIHEEAKA